jgi:hypothetical protein
MGECKECDLKRRKGGICPIFNDRMEDGLGCPAFSDGRTVCSICGDPIPRGGIVEEDNEGYYLVCANCGSHSGTCRICRYADTCAFQNDTSCAEPPYVMAQQRQGNMVIQQQVMNPKRIEATCRKSCTCFNEDGLDNGTFCRKQTVGFCGNLIVKGRNG